MNKRNDIPIGLEKVVIDDIPGFYLNDIEKTMPADLYRKLDRWLFGKTLLEVNGKILVYQWDFEKFLDDQLLQRIEN